MHAPENEASEKGISKAGFLFETKVTITPENEVIVYADDPTPELSSLIRFGNLVKSEKEQATCWNCSSPFVKNRKAECCCADRSMECNYQTAGT